VIGTCLLIGDVPEDVAVTVKVLEPTGVPGFWLVAALLLALEPTPQAVHQTVASIKALTMPKRRPLPRTLLPFLFTKKAPTNPGSNIV
jgi:hypothetical protein